MSVGNIVALLIWPPPVIEEGPLGYLSRLAEANLLSVRQLGSLGVHFDSVLLQEGCTNEDGVDTDVVSYATVTSRLAQDYPAIWIRRLRRCCPLCLGETPIWRLGWELKFSDACPRHKVWLVDQCSGCHQPYTWERGEFLRCSCGASLAGQMVNACPDAVAALADVIGRRAWHRTPAAAPIGDLQVWQVVRLVQFLGAYGSGQLRRRPQKIPNLDHLSTSWQFSSIASAILSNWPQAFYTMLRNLLASAESRSAGKMGASFGHFYDLLYRAFPEQEFDFLRRAFEDFIADNWTGTLARRNRRLSPAILNRAAWIPEPAARDQMKVSGRRLRQLIADKRVAAETRTSVSGRQFIVVSRDDVRRHTEALAQELNLVSAADRLGLTKRRFAALLPHLVPSARKVGDTGCAWTIPSDKINALATQMAALPIATELPAGTLPLRHILKFMRWSDREMAAFLDTVIEGCMRPISRLVALPGITGMIFERSELDQWRNARQEKKTWITIPEAAERLHIKQEVAYFLVQEKLLASQPLPEKWRGRAVREEDLAKFNRGYIWARDLAIEIETSPRFVADALAKLGVMPVAGPALRTGRQNLYERSGELDRAVVQLLAGLQRGKAGRRCRPARR